ncbi:hypothetical protein GMORB2_0321 [Geosmithia morbida]|uniref:Uncharacterized protein n=1 Tax=Geosmithia morbida TaxID=1094350 RepID=A0A9P4Z101_9HYPO|nr:uncharacterized protein GMORB2_0321 [Geosmithia morbida]KAF4126585.1 hypothetical protein GMORB2_0321 [Geosmithia morbida]
MPESAQAAAPAAAGGNPNSLGDNKGIKFHIKTGGKSYDCVLQDRSAYERKKAALSGLAESVGSSSSSAKSS